VTELGYGKRTDVAEYRHQTRGGSGVINVKVTDKNGPVVGIKSVADTDELLLITEQGILIRFAAAGVRETGRAAVGVRLIDLEPGDRVVGVAKVAERDDEPEPGPEPDGGLDGGPGGSDPEGDGQSDPGVAT
jgi:DNA gyrase subunit A